ncbi:hypothetical protein BC826DRAFT_972677 [Russula brevipes]|nr:hypothetical protein BC826DRAFT_972677 [Russula brevipes]
MALRAAPRVMASVTSAHPTRRRFAPPFGVGHSALSSTHAIGPSAMFRALARDTHAVSQQLGQCCDPEASPALLPSPWFTPLVGVGHGASSTTHVTADVASAPATPCDPEVVRCHPQAPHPAAHTRWKTSHPHLQPHVTPSPWWFAATRRGFDFEHHTQHHTRDGRHCVHTCKPVRAGGSLPPTGLRLRAPQTTPHTMADVASAPATPCNPEPVVVRCRPRGFDFEHHAQHHTQWRNIASAPATPCDPEPMVVRCRLRDFDFKHHAQHHTRWRNIASAPATLCDSKVVRCGASSTTHNSAVRIVEGLDEGYQCGVEALYVFREY